MSRGLIKILADGAFHSGVELGDLLGISRAGVWKQVQALGDLGLTIDAVRGKGYRVAGGIDLLDAGRIRGAMADPVLRRISRLEILDVVDSTNSVVLDAFRKGSGDGFVCLTEQQTAGRGRRGREWVSPFAANIYLSAGREFAGGFSSIDGLSLAMGVAVCEAIEALGISGVGLKWPNDIIFRDRKLGGLLIEVGGDVGGACQAVIGVGLNVAMPPRYSERIGQPWVDLAEAGLAGGRRNDVAGCLLRALIPAMDEFARDGLGAFLTRWQRFDLVRGCEIDVISAGSSMRGIACGVDPSGGLRVDTGFGEQIFRSGEVSIRRRG